MWCFVWRLPLEKIAVPHFLPPDCTELRMLLSCALHSWQYIHESQSCWHPVCKSFRRNFSTESHWDVTLNTQLLFGSHAAAFMQRLGISSNTWEPNHQLRHNCKPGLQFTAGLCAGLKVSTCKEHQSIFTRATHGSVPLSAASQSGQKLLCKYNQPSMSTNYTDEHWFE